MHMSDKPINAAVADSRINKKGSNRIFPVCQMLSEKQDANFLSYWLNEWRKSGPKTPYVVVTDMGKALQNAATMSFNITTFRDYNINCLLILQNKRNSVKNMNFWIRTDLAYLINAVSR